MNANWDICEEVIIEVELADPKDKVLGKKIYANQYGYSDVQPHEVVNIKTAKKIEIRAMDAEKDPSWKPKFHPGGFSAHCSNQQDQKWFYKSLKSFPIFAIRLHKDGWWRDLDGKRFRLSWKPKKFHDYNF